MFSKRKGFSTVYFHFKNNGQFLRYCKLSDQFNNARVTIQDEIVKTDLLIAQGARSTKVKSALPNVRQMKDVMDKDLNEQRTLMCPELANVKKDFFSPKKAILAEVERDFQKATLQWVGYVNQDSEEIKSQLEEPEADDATVAEERSKARDLSPNVETDQDKRKKNAVEKTNQSLKLLKSLNDTFSRDESTKYEEGSTKYNAPADVSHEL